MITLKEICFEYRSGQPVLSGIDLDLKQGNIYGLLGKNGEGKTTLLKLICGLLFPKKGKCLVCGETPSERRVSFLQQLFYLPEEISFPDVKAIDYIRMYSPFYPSFRDDILKSCLEAFEIECNKPLSQMSFGQKKKVAITLALAVNTPILLMDEPTNGLDIPTKTIFRQLAASLMDESRLILISTHQVRDLESLIDAVVILDKEQILLNETLEEIARKLFFRLVDPNEEALYSEPVPQGIMAVGKNLDNEETAVSLELLFNAAATCPEKIKQIFN